MISELLKNYMEENKITASEMCELIGVNASNLRNYLNDIHSPGDLKLIEISKIMGIEQSKLIAMAYDDKARRKLEKEKAEKAREKAKREYFNKQKQQREDEIKDKASKAELVNEWTITVIKHSQPIVSVDIDEESILQAFKDGYLYVGGMYLNTDYIVSFEKNEKYYIGNKEAPIEVVRYISSGKLVLF